VHYSGNSNETVFYFGDFVRVVNSTGVYDTVYYKTGTSLVAERKNDSTMTFYHPDHLGSTSLMTNSTGGKVEENLYQPYGAVYFGGDKSRFSYNNKEVDSTNLMYYGSRYYNPTLGVFTQPDTIQQNIYDPQLLNKYLYTRANPYKYIDPDGHKVSHYTVLPTNDWVKNKEGKYDPIFTGYKIEYQIEGEKETHEYSLPISEYIKTNKKSDDMANTPYSRISSTYGGYDMYQEYMVQYLEEKQGRNYNPKHISQEVIQNDDFQTLAVTGLGIGAAGLGELAVPTGGGFYSGAGVMGSVQANFADMSLQEKKAQQGSLSMDDYTWATMDVIVATYGSTAVGKFEGNVLKVAVTDGIRTQAYNNIVSSILYADIKDNVRNDK
jgi:RHS repeat-associated protein